MSIADDISITFHSRQQNSANFREVINDLTLLGPRLCNIGSSDYWEGIKINPDITHAFTLYGASQSKVRNARPALKAFALIKDGYSCSRAQVQRDKGGRFVKRSADILKAKSTTSVAHCDVSHVGTWYIELFCAVEKQGGRLMDHVIQTAKKRGIQYITLSALPYVVNYYRNKYGFRLTLSDNKCQETDAMKRVADRHSKMMFDSVASALQSREFKPVLKQASAEGLAMKKNVDEHSCSSIQSCAEDGLFMVLCLKSHQILPVTVKRK